MLSPRGLRSWPVRSNSGKSILDLSPEISSSRSVGTPNKDIWSDGSIAAIPKSRLHNEKFAVQDTLAHQTFMTESHDLMGDIPNYTNMKPSSRLARPWASAGPFDVEASHVRAHRSICSN